MDYRFEKLGKDVSLCVSDEHTFGTDAFLLTEFSRARRKDKVCDLGTGCGIIAVLTKLRFGSKEIVAVDIQKQAIEQLDITLQSSPLEGIRAMNADLREMPVYLNGFFDLCICNPPYKAIGTGMISESDADKIARHESMCTDKDLCRAAARLLRFGGRLCVCGRTERLADMMVSMREQGLEPKRMRLVHKDENSEPWLFLLEGRKGGKSFLRCEPPLFMKDGGISPELKAIYAESCE